jgi:hypothetical protein
MWSIHTQRHSHTPTTTLSFQVWLVRLVSVAGERELEGQLLRRALVRTAQLGLHVLHEQALLALALHKVNHPPRRPDDLNTTALQAPAATASQVVWRALGNSSSSVAGGGHNAAGLVLETCMRSALGHSMLAGTEAIGGTGIKVPADLLARSVCLKASHDAQQNGPARALSQLLVARDAFPKHLISLWHHAALLLLLQKALASKQHSRAQVGGPPAVRAACSTLVFCRWPAAGCVLQGRLTG